MRPEPDISTDRRFLLRAVALARANIVANSGGPFGAIVVQDSQIVAEGTNQVVARSDPTAHAEIVAIREATRLRQSPHLESATIYTSCEPCPMCLGAIYWARIARVVFALSRQDAARMGFADDHIYRDINLPHDRRTVEFQHVDLPEAAAILADWMNFPDRRIY